MSYFQNSLTVVQTDILATDDTLPADANALSATVSNGIGDGGSPIYIEVSETGSFNVVLTGTDANNTPITETLTFSVSTESDLNYRTITSIVSDTEKTVVSCYFEGDPTLVGEAFILNRYQSPSNITVTLENQDSDNPQDADAQITFEDPEGSYTDSFIEDATWYTVATLADTETVTQTTLSERATAIRGRVTDITSATTTAVGDVRITFIQGQNA